MGKGTLSWVDEFIVDTLEFISQGRFSGEKNRVSLLTSVGGNNFCIIQSIFLRDEGLKGEGYNA